MMVQFLGNVVMSREPSYITLNAALLAIRFFEAPTIMAASAALRSGWAAF
ncbi:hypothetical protein GA0061105_14215, partial [Rhizobium aethiopicum]